MSSEDQPHALYLCDVGHVRVRPFRHAFRYRVFSLLLDLDRLDRLPRLLSHNRFNLFSFHDRDHGARDGGDLRPWVEDQLRSRGIDPPGGPIRLLCFPRVLGYTFNPLSLYYCADRQGRIAAIVYEVKNTFGDQHTYVCAAGDDPERIDQTQPKEFHVSPFFGMEGGYRFRLSPPGERLSIAIHYGDAAGDLMTATQTGRRRDLTTRSLLAAFAAHPMLTWKIMAGIHWEAWKLWRKGAAFHRRPDPPVRHSRAIPLAGIEKGPTYPPTPLETIE